MRTVSVAAKPTLPPATALSASLKNGDWTYSLDTANGDVAGLEVGESVSDVIPLESADGTPTALVIRVTALTQVAEIN